MRPVMAQGSHSGAVLLGHRGLAGRRLVAVIETLWRWRVWIMAASVTAFAALLRLVNLGSPSSLVFDEVHYVPGAYSLLVLGYEGDWEGDKQVFAEGDYSGLETEGDYVVHPMVGKLLMAAGMKIAGVTPFGWRFAGAVIGTVTVLIVALLMRRILASTLWGGVAGLLLALDGEHLVLSRTALLDVFLTFFVVAGFALLWLDRWRAQRIYKAWADAESGSGAGAESGPGAGPGRALPRVGVRWWRLAAIVAFGLATGVKWSGATFAAGFLVLFVVLDAWDRRASGQPSWLSASFWRTAVPGAIAAVVLLPTVYVAQWANWFLTSGSYYRQWAAEHPGEGVTWLPPALRSLWQYHVSMYNFHKDLDSPHSWESHPSGWLIQFRPTLFYFETMPDGTCGAQRCQEAITSVGNPLLWWLGVAALCWAIWRLVARNEALGMILASGTLLAWLPWAPIAHRTVFTFYTVVMAPFVVMTLTWALMRLARPLEYEGRYYRKGALAAGWILVAIIAVSAFFFPVWTGETIPDWYRTMHVWLPTW